MIKQARGAIIVNKCGHNNENWTLFTILPPPNHEGEDWPLVEEAVREWYEGNDSSGYKIMSITRFTRNPCNLFEVVVNVATGDVVKTEIVQFDYTRVCLFKTKQRKMVQLSLF